MGNNTHAQTCVLHAGQLLLPAPYQFSTRSAWATGKTTLSYRTPAWCRYYLHAYGSVYGVTGRVASDVIARNAASLRMLANEGAWVRFHVPMVFGQKTVRAMEHCKRTGAAAHTVKKMGTAGLTDLLAKSSATM